jgi:hypothetical protein
MIVDAKPSTHAQLKQRHIHQVKMHPVDALPGHVVALPIISFSTLKNEGSILTCMQNKGLCHTRTE